MTVTINELVLKRMLETPAGPVGLEVSRLAQDVVDNAQENIRKIMARSPVTVENNVAFALESDLTAIIGIRDSGRVTQYLARKVQREGGSWLLSALQDTFDSN